MSCHCHVYGREGGLAVFRNPYHYCVSGYRRTTTQIQTLPDVGGIPLRVAYEQSKAWSIYIIFSYIQLYVQNE